MKSLKIVLMAAIMMVPIFALAQHQLQSVKEMMNDKAMQDSAMSMICSSPMMMKHPEMMKMMQNRMQQKG